MPEKEAETKACKQTESLHTIYQGKSFCITHLRASYQIKLNFFVQKSIKKNFPSYFLVLLCLNADHF